MAIFVGRQRELGELRELCCFSDLIVIHGLKGIGKSSFVKQFCENIDHTFIDVRRREEHPLQLVQMIESEMEDIKRTKNREINKPSIDNSNWKSDSLNTSNVHLACTRRTICRRKEIEILLVLDNAEEICADSRSISTLTSISKLPGVTILITSTVSPAEMNEQLTELPLKPLPYTDAHALLRTICPSTEDNYFIPKIIELCEGIPLALQIVGLELQSALLTPEDLAILLTHSRLKVLSQEYFPKDDQIESTYREFLNKISEPLQEALSTLNYIPGTFNEYEASSILGDSNVNINNTLRSCTQHHLIFKSERANRYDIHGILRDCVKEFIKIKHLPRVRKRFCDTFSKILQEIESRSSTEDYCWAMSQFSVEYGNIWKLFKEVIHCTSDYYHVFVELATTLTIGRVLLKTMTLYQAMIEFFGHCLERTRLFGQELDESRVLSGYGRVLTNITGDLTEGAEMYQRALDKRKRYPKTRDYHLAFLLQSYGWNLGMQGKYKAALKYLREAYCVEQDLGMYSERLILQTLQSLALFYIFSDDIEKGEQFQVECYKRRLKAIGTKNHPIMGSTLNNMGCMFLRKGDINTALDYQRQGLEIKISTGAPVKDIALSERDLAETILAKGDYSEAITLLDQALTRLQGFPGLFDDVKVLLLKTKGKCYFKAHEYFEASKHLRRAIDLKLKTCEDDSFMVKLYCLYADVLLALGENGKVVKILKKALLRKDNFIQQTSTNQSLYHSYRILLEAHFSLRNREELFRTYGEGCSELQRLIKVFENVPNFYRRTDMSENFLKFKERFEEMKRFLDLNHTLNVHSTYTKR
ncbi:uncharacterized protein LOC133184983 [Saccostrea echinata]|uniref:uncharacterized protein LOC133184983 n=1 Tax=Saccostrea echinata TaxID=191078 RepID=UPI002A816F29|nr:uncharacterized protein LOC133184983 [Saccostrea echinata]